MIGKRLFWLTAGSVAGAVGSEWAKRKARRAAAAYAPTEVGKRLASTAEQRVRAAAAEARAASADTEARLRERFGAGGPRR